MKILTSLASLLLPLAAFATEPTHFRCVPGELENGLNVRILLLELFPARSRATMSLIFLDSEVAKTELGYEQAGEAISFHPLTREEPPFHLSLRQKTGGWKATVTKEGEGRSSFLECRAWWDNAVRR